MNRSTLFLNSWLPTIISDAGIRWTRQSVHLSCFRLAGIGRRLVLGKLLDRTFRSGSWRCATRGRRCSCTQSAHAGASVPLLGMTIVCAGVGIIGGQNASHALSSEFYPTGIRSTGVGWASRDRPNRIDRGSGVGGLLLSRYADATVFWAAVIPAVAATWQRLISHEDQTLMRDS